MDLHAKKNESTIIIYEHDSQLMVESFRTVFYFGQTATFFFNIGESVYGYPVEKNKIKLQPAKTEIKWKNIYTNMVSRVSSVPSEGRTRVVEGRFYLGSTLTGPTFRHYINVVVV